MDPEQFIKESPEKASALATEWEDFIATSARENPEILSINSKEEFYRWTTQHPEKHIDPNIWLGKEITDFYLMRRQQDSSAQAQASNDKKEERQREGAREIPRESISRPTSPSTTQQPQIQTPTRGFFNRGVGRGIGGIERGPARLGGRVAGRTGGMAGRLASRLAVQAGMAAGRGVVAGAVAIGSTGWLVIGVIAAIFVATIILIILLEGGGGIVGGGPPPALPRLYECKFGGFPTSFPANCNSGPPVRCVGPGTGELVSVDAPDGNTCAANAAVNYSEIEGVTITTKCVDKCIDNSVTNVCEPDASNACPDPNPKCGGATGVVLKTFCIEYTIVPATPTPTPTPTTPAPPAFGAFFGAEGYGAVSIGGRGGQVIEITTLADDVPAPAGSLRACAEASGPRTCVFRVGGTIALKPGAGFRIENPYLTIAGQTAPGGGILITGYGGIGVMTHNVIIRYLRFRLDPAGVPGTGQTALFIGNGAYNIIVDHCSSSWALDDNINLWKQPSPPSPDITDVTFQRCFIAETLRGHSTAMLIGGEANYGVNPPLEEYLRVHDISVHHNLFAHNYDRNPRMSTAGTQVINNVVYNWGSRVGVSAMKNTVDFINNYWKPGPMSGSLIYKHESMEITNGWVYPDPDIYIAGNIVKGIFENPSADNWELIKTDEATGNPVTLLPLSYRRFTPILQSPNPITIQSAADAYTSVLADAGANARLDCKGNWVPNPDAVDIRVLADVNNGTGWTFSTLPASPAEAGGFPIIAAGAPCIDSDSDGMADEWETLHFNSLSQGSLFDSSSDFDSDGYTDLEEFLNGTNPKN